MTKKEFQEKLERLIFDYCGQNNDYEDFDVYFDYYVNNVDYSISIVIDRQSFSDEEEES